MSRRRSSGCEGPATGAPKKKKRGAAHRRACGGGHAEPATLVWVRALDNGDPKKKVPHRDSVVMLKAPFTGEPTELFKVEQRFENMTWGERDGMVLISDFERDKRWVRTFLVNANKPDAPAKLVWSRNQQDRYNDPGTPVTKVTNGQRVMLLSG